MTPTPKQATTWLAALDNLIERESRYRSYEGIRDDTYKWEREAIFRLRGLLISCDATMKASDRQAEQDTVEVLRP